MVVGLAIGARQKRDRQPLSFCLSYTVVRLVSASLFAKGNKKAQSHHTPVALGNGRLRLQ